MINDYSDKPRSYCKEVPLLASHPRPPCQDQAPRHVAVPPGAATTTTTRRANEAQLRQLLAVGPDGVRQA